MPKDIMSGSAGGWSRTVETVVRTLRVLLITEENDEGRWWVAKCLDHEFTAHARTLKDAKYAFERALVARFEMALKRGWSDPFQGLQPASERYWKMWESGDRLELDVTSTLSTDLPAPQVYARVA